MYWVTKRDKNVIRRTTGRLHCSKSGLVIRSRTKGKWVHNRPKTTQKSNTRTKKVINVISKNEREQYCKQKRLAQDDAPLILTLYISCCTVKRVLVDTVVSQTSYLNVLQTSISIYFATVKVHIDNSHYTIMVDRQIGLECFIVEKKDTETSALQ